MKYFLILLLLLFAGVAAAAENITPHDFGAGFSLKVIKTGPIYSFELPKDVYHTVKRTDLGDIRIFNGAGEVVPHNLRSITHDLQSAKEKENVPFFPLYRNNTGGEEAELELKITRNNKGTIVAIGSGRNPGEKHSEINGYLLDLSGVKRKSEELEFFWRPDVDSALYSVFIQQSDDLLHWTTIVNKATLADLQYGGQEIKKRTVRLSHAPQKYLKLTWYKSNKPLNIYKISSYSNVIESRKKRQWIEIQNGRIERKEDLEIDFKTKYLSAKTSMQVGFPDTNSIADIQVQSRSDDSSSWSLRCEKVFYSLKINDQVLQNEPCVFSPTTDVHWRLIIKQNGAGLGVDKKSVSLQLGWEARELFFVGRGAEPFLLAFGSGKLEYQPDTTDGAMILDSIKAESATRLLGVIELGDKIILGGEKALLSDPLPIQWKKWLLWTVLVLGVFILALMARSLFREMT